MSEGFVYFIRPIGMPAPIKIGHSGNPAIRADELSHFSPYKLEVAASVPGGPDLERLLQDCFADLHSHNEWFLGHPRLLKAVSDLQAGVALEAAIDLQDRRGNLRGLVIRAAMKRNGSTYHGGKRP